MSQGFRVLVLGGLAVLGVIVFAVWKGALLPRHASQGAPTESIALQPFSGLQVDGTAEVSLRQGTTEAVAITVAENQRAHVRADVRNGVLEIRVRTADGWFSQLFRPRPRTPRILVDFRSLDRIGLSGAVKLHAPRLRAARLGIHVSGAATLDLPHLEADELLVEGSGAVKAAIAGRAQAQHVLVSGAADYKAPQFVTDHATIDVSGAGRVLVRAEKTLDVHLSGAGKVQYLGDPELTKDVSGAGSIRRYEGEARPAATTLLATG